MHLCPTCRGALQPGQAHCGVCGTDVSALTVVDPTAQAPTGSAVPPPPGYQAPGHQAPGYPAPGFQAPPAPSYPAPVHPAPYGAGAPHGYPPAAYGAPGYAVVPAPRSKTVAALLCVFLGGLGVHRFYTGQTGLGLALLLTTLILGTCTLGLWLAVTAIWVLVDLILILTGGVRDQYGRELIW